MKKTYPIFWEINHKEGTDDLNGTFADDQDSIKIVPITFRFQQTLRILSNIFWVCVWPAKYYWAVCGQMTSSLCRCLNQILIQYLISIWKKLNATSSPVEAATTTGFGALDDMAWLNGLQVKLATKNFDVMMRVWN